MPSYGLPTKAGTFTWRETAGHEPEVLLVTSRKTGEWIVPLGGVEAGETFSQAAARETREEAGAAVAVGTRIDDLTWRDAKGRVRSCRFYVAGYLADCDWLEKDLRERGWFTLEQARERIVEPFRPLLEQSIAMRASR